MLDATLRAALLAAFIGLLSVTGIGWFLGFPLAGSAVAGVVTALLAGALLWGASRRAESFHTPDEHEPENR